MPTQNQRIYWEYKQHPKKNHKQINFRMSTKKMADIMYAIICTHANLINTFHLGYEYDRKTNAYHNCYAIVEIAPQLEAEFEVISSCKLEPIQEAKPNKVSEIY